MRLQWRRITLSSSRSSPFLALRLRKPAAIVAEGRNQAISALAGLRFAVAAIGKFHQVEHAGSDATSKPTRQST